jgi:uncharacterized protein YdhG (YjbR/CyaY superfamily)
MKYEATSIKDYIDQLPEDRQPVIKKLRSVINKNLPKGFKEKIQYNMPGWVVPLSTYPSGYHASKEPLPLPFINIASQKNFVALYHSGVYSSPALNKWFVEEYPKHCKNKLDMGKSCIRFKKMDDIPYELIGELASKITVEDWITTYEAALKKK